MDCSELLLPVVVDGGESITATTVLENHSCSGSFFSPPSATKSTKRIPVWLTSERRSGKMYIRLNLPLQIECSTQLFP